MFGWGRNNTLAYIWGGESALSRRCAVLEKRGPKAAFSFSLPHVSFSLFSSYSCPFGPVMDFPWISDVSGNRKHAGYLSKSTGPSVVGR